MKKTYVAPDLEIERYELDANIASHCTVVVTMGDYGGDTSKGEDACSDYLAMVGITQDESAVSLNEYNVNFWKNTCDCYTTAGGEGFFTS